MFIGSHFGLSWLEYKLPFGDNKNCFTDLSAVTVSLNTFLYLARGFIEHARRSLFAGAAYRGRQGEIASNLLQKVICGAGGNGDAFQPALE